MQGRVQRLPSNGCTVWISLRVIDWSNGNINYFWINIYKQLQLVNACIHVSDVSFIDIYQRKHELGFLELVEEMRLP